MSDYGTQSDDMQLVPYGDDADLQLVPHGGDDALQMVPRRTDDDLQLAPRAGGAELQVGHPSRVEEPGRCGSQDGFHTASDDEDMLSEYDSEARYTQYNVQNIQVNARHLEVTRTEENTAILYNDFSTRLSQVATHGEQRLQAAGEFIMAEVEKRLHVTEATANERTAQEAATLRQLVTQVATDLVARLDEVQQAQEADLSTTEVVQAAQQDFRESLTRVEEALAATVSHNHTQTQAVDAQLQTMAHGQQAVLEYAKKGRDETEALNEQVEQLRGLVKQQDGRVSQLEQDLPVQETAIAQAMRLEKEIAQIKASQARDAAKSDKSGPGMEEVVLQALKKSAARKYCEEIARESTRQTLAAYPVHTVVQTSAPATTAAATTATAAPSAAAAATAVAALPAPAQTTAVAAPLTTTGLDLPWNAPVLPVTSGLPLPISAIAANPLMMSPRSRMQAQADGSGEGDGSGDARRVKGRRSGRRARTRPQGTDPGTGGGSAVGATGLSQHAPAVSLGNVQGYSVGSYPAASLPTPQATAALIHGQTADPVWDAQNLGQPGLAHPVPSVDPLTFANPYSSYGPAYHLGGQAAMISLGSYPSGGAGTGPSAGVPPVFPQPQGSGGRRDRGRPRDTGGGGGGGGDDDGGGGGGGDGGDGGNDPGSDSDGDGDGGQGPAFVNGYAAPHMRR